MYVHMSYNLTLLSPPETESSHTTQRFLVRVYICIYVYVHVYIHIHIYTYTHIFLYIERERHTQIYRYIYMLPPPLKPTFYRKTMACALENPFQAAFPGKYTFHNKYVTNTRDIPLL